MIKIEIEEARAHAKGFVGYARVRRRRAGDLELKGRTREGGEGGI